MLPLEALEEHREKNLEREKPCPIRLGKNPKPKLRKPKTKTVKAKDPGKKKEMGLNDENLR